MQHTVLSPVGVEVSGLALPDAGPDEVSEVKDLLADHGVAVFRDQDVDDDDFLSFLRRFGDLLFTTGETPVDGFPDLNVISNIGRTTPPKSTFHVDSSYLSRPPAYTALRAVRIPSQGGQTLFTNQYLAFDTLPADVVERLEGRSITHVVTGLDLGDDDETSAVHPVFWKHPISGRTALYLSTPTRCAAISGLAPLEAEETVRYLFEHSTSEANTFRHTWLPGDVVMWDNRCVLHRADHADVVGDRLMHRGMVAG
jgi:taurine dioxygenase